MVYGLHGIIFHITLLHLIFLPTLIDQSGFRNQTGLFEQMTPNFVPHEQYQEYPVEEMRERAQAFYADIQRRRTIREFSDRPVPRDIIET